MEEIKSEFTEEQEALVKEAWQIMQQDIPEHSLHFFTLILKIAPEAKKKFSFLNDADDGILENNAELKDHALNVFKMTCEAAVQLREKGEVVVENTTLDAIAAVHYKKGVAKNHFPIMRTALLRTVKEAVGDEKWSDEMQEAWTVAFDELADAILAGMQEREEANAGAEAAAAPEESS